MEKLTIASFEPLPLLLVSFKSLVRDFLQGPLPFPWFLVSERELMPLLEELHLEEICDSKEKICDILCLLLFVRGKYGYRDVLKLCPCGVHCCMGQEMWQIPVSFGIL